MDKAEWYSLQIGQTIFTRNNVPRKILDKKHGCITLKAIRPTKYGVDTVTYVSSDRKLLYLKEKKMGGQNETTITGLRMHVNNCKVHVHDDSKKMKYERTSGNFKSEVEDALKQLENQDGIIKVDGDTDTSFYIFKEGKNLNAFISNNKNTKKDIVDFLKGC